MLNQKEKNMDFKFYRFHGYFADGVYQINEVNWIDVWAFDEAHAETQLKVKLKEMYPAIHERFVVTSIERILSNEEDHEFLEWMREWLNPESKEGEI